MQLLPQVTFSGIVSDADSGAPIPGAVVTFLDSPGARDCCPIPCSGPRSTPGTGNRIDLRASYLPGGDHLIRVTNALPGFPPTSFTVILSYRD